MAALLLGLVAGLRTFTAPAMLCLFRRRGGLGYILGVLALLEYGADLDPRAPARTGPVGLTARVLGGSFCGWALTAGNGTSPGLNPVFGACGAVIGAYLGLAARMRAIELIGTVPAALVEDGAAIAAAALIVAYA
ncbi:MAG TPA: hypothetical protein VIX60_03990 [Candidatus Cybelea sp.]